MSKEYYEQDVYNQNHAHKRSVTLVRSHNDKPVAIASPDEENLTKEERIKRQILSLYQFYLIFSPSLILYRF